MDMDRVSRYMGLDPDFSGWIVNKLKVLGLKDILLVF